ncbi:MAG: hypothetical protein GEU83_18865 [Pseudonocardiaceae bacterium]|nr:hypothetical protein [Pseudonocardiaceae bacterium]
MLESDARKIVTEIQQKIGQDDTADQALSATVKTDRSQPSYSPPGAGRPTFIQYYIQISDGSRTALLDLDQAAALRDEIEPNADADSVFGAIRSQEVRIDDVE